MMLKDGPRQRAAKYAAVVICRTVDGEQRTTATVHGSWAVHRSLDAHSSDWAITQVPTGLAIPRELTCMLKKAQAIEAAKAIDAEVGDRRVTVQVGKVIAAIIHRVLTRSTKKTPGDLQHEADVAEGCT